MDKERTLEIGLATMTKHDGTVLPGFGCVEIDRAAGTTSILFECEHQGGVEQEGPAAAVRIELETRSTQYEAAGIPRRHVYQRGDNWRVQVALTQCNVWVRKTWRHDVSPSEVELWWTLSPWLTCFQFAQNRFGEPVADLLDTTEIKWRPGRVSDLALGSEVVSFVGANDESAQRTRKAATIGLRSKVPNGGAIPAALAPLQQQLQLLKAFVEVFARTEITVPQHDLALVDAEGQRQQWKCFCAEPWKERNGYLSPDALCVIEQFHASMPIPKLACDAIFGLAAAQGLTIEHGLVAQFAALECMLADWVHNHDGLEILRAHRDRASDRWPSDGDKPYKGHFKAWEEGKNPEVAVSIWVASVHLGVRIDDLFGERPSLKPDFVVARDAIVHGRGTRPDSLQCAQHCSAIERAILRIAFAIYGWAEGPARARFAHYWFNRSPTQFWTQPAAELWPVVVTVGPSSPSETG